ncbi:hypothetical protein LV716_06315 [Flagellimonas sp. HMM57]|uniref:hypothetical protein n=1 Tax=unclassified Flagellimonas TaxID=2644544 RepID=UPI0013D8C173|nr:MULTISPECIES: hypothetical protein [unclassified Flagellimonas]UII77382.1 hypothetical protein LV716_06315 [Flagellimonas sp. HMM57]
MKKGLKIGCSVLIVLMLIAVVFGVIADRSDGPRQSFKFVNTSNGTKSVTFEMFNADGELSDVWYVDEKLEPNSSIIKRIPEGKYKISVWDDNDNLYKEIIFEFKLENPDESDYRLYRFDLAMDKHHVLVCMNALYEGNSLSESISKVAGTNHNSLKIEQIYNGNLPYRISETYTGRTFKDLGESLPRTIRSRELIYRLFAFPDSLSTNQIDKKLRRGLLDNYID